MENLLDLKVREVQSLSLAELKNVNGGTTNPTYDIKDNYDGLVYSTKLSAPVAVEVLKATAYNIMKFIFL